jgi:RHH-type proline utilization regulon transcriptional repressor/proline dehydrogenase/delta 1-pyrroline-5-carboxylate dehydrogenase
VDIGPVITRDAKDIIERHIAAMRAKGRAVEQLPLPPETTQGTFVAPTIIELDSIADLTREVFGPVLHVVRYKRADLDKLIAAINATGYGLTFGLHTRLEETIAHVTSRVRAGNHYVNRNVIGAIVGVQPFGGRGLSGTGPKAGGPLYLARLVQDDPNPLPTAPGTPDPALSDFIAWLDGRGEVVSAATAGAFAARSALGLERELPGPVGERNLYALHPRGTILLLPATMAGLHQQIAATLATGNHGRVEGFALPADLPASVAARLAPPVDGALAGALIEGAPDQLLAALQQVVARPGPVLLAQAASPADCANGPAYRLDWLLEEVSTSINTTASGGNASLMTIA